MDSDKRDRIVIYTDGACQPNPGPGAWAAVLLRAGQPPQELVGTDPATTNNRMELQAAMEALKALPDASDVRLITDSRYLQRGVTEWLPEWERRQWRTAGNEDVKNRDLWQALSRHLARHRVEWEWTRGHANDPWNERADFLAQSAIPNTALPVDDQAVVHAFTAASCLGSDGRGGWGVVLKYREHAKSLHGGERATSGNRMHLMAAIAALEAVKPGLPLNVYTTSDYLKDGATFWMSNWAKGGWHTKEGKAVANQDMWARLLELCQSRQVRWFSVSKSDIPVEMTHAKGAAAQAARDA